MKTLSVLLCLFVVSCSTYKPPDKLYQFDSTKEFAASRDKIWDATIQFLLKYKMFPTVIEKASGLMKYSGDLMEFQGLNKDTWNGDRLIKPIFDCGTVGIQKTPAQFKDGEVVIYITEADGKVKVHVECKRVSFDALQGDMKCISTGALEKELFESLSTLNGNKN